MNLQSQFNSAGKFVRSNSPAILTGLSIAGVISTAALTARATYKAAMLIDEIEEQEINETGKLTDRSPERTKKIIKATWSLYIPPAIAGGLTISSMVSANKIHANRTAAALTAYALSETAFGEYRKKIVDTYNASKEERIRTAIMQDKVARTEVPGELVAATAADRKKVLQGQQSKEVIILDRKHVRCFEGFSGRYFLGDMDAIKQAVNQVNQFIIKNDDANLSLFYDLIDIPHTQISDDFGWDVNKMLELEWYTVICPGDNEPCIAFDYRYMPMSLYNKK